MVPFGVIATIEYRLRLKEQEIRELKLALLKHITGLINERKITWDQYVFLRKLYYRLGRVGKVRGGSPAKVFHFNHESEEAMYDDMKGWLKYRWMETREPEKFEEERKRAIASIKR